MENEPNEFRSASAKPPIPFIPVPVRPRHDGWTAEKQIRLIETLAATKCVDEACRRHRYGKWLEPLPAPEPRSDERQFALGDALIDIAIKAPEKDGNPVDEWLCDEEEDRERGRARKRGRKRELTRACARWAANLANFRDR